MSKYECIYILKCVYIHIHTYNRMSLNMRRSEYITKDLTKLISTRTCCYVFYKLDEILISLIQDKHRTSCNILYLKTERVFIQFYMHQSINNLDIKVQINNIVSRDACICELTGSEHEATQRKRCIAILGEKILCSLVARGTRSARVWISRNDRASEKQLRMDPTLIEQPCEAATQIA